MACITLTLCGLKAILVNTSLTDEALQFALDTATTVICEDLKPKCSMTDDRYQRIGYLLAAHFAQGITQSSDGVSGQLRRSKLGEADESYSEISNTFTGYQTSRWGQMALALDKCGVLAASQTNSGLKAQIEVVGGCR